MTNAAECLFRVGCREDLESIIGLLADDIFGQARNSGYRDAAVAYDTAFAEMTGNVNNMVIVGERGGRLVGCYQLTFIRGLSHNGAIRAQIESVRIASDLRGAGLGTAMIRDAIRRARERGANIMQLTTDLRREKTRTFYERLGFATSHHGMKLAL